MNKLLQNLQKRDVFWRKIIVFGALFILAVPLLVLIVRNLNNRMTNLQGEQLLKTSEIPDSETPSLVEDLLSQLEQLAQTATSTFIATSILPAASTLGAAATTTATTTDF